MHLPYHRFFPHFFFTVERVPSFHNIVERNSELTAQNPFPPILMTFHPSFEGLPCSHPGVLVSQQYEVIPHLGQITACDSDLTSHSTHPTNSMTATETSMWPKFSQSSSIQACGRTSVRVTQNRTGLHSTYSWTWKMWGCVCWKSLFSKLNP